jgi:hypothetical protein
VTLAVQCCNRGHPFGRSARYKRAEHEDYYDRDTDFSPFKLD